MEVVFKSAVYTTPVSLTIKSRIWASHTNGVIKITCKNYKIFMKAYHLAFIFYHFCPYMTGFISPLLMLSWSKFPPEVNSLQYSLGETV